MLALLFANIGVFGVFLFLTYYLQRILGWSPIRTGLAFLPMVVALAVMAQVSNRIVLPRFGPKLVVPVGLLISAVALFGLHDVGVHTGYLTHVLPFSILIGFGFGLSLAPSFSTGTLGLQPYDAGVGSAVVNTSQQVGGSIGTALLNTVAASAASAYLVGRAHTSTALKAAALHSYTTAFLWAAVIFIVGAMVSGLVLRRGDLATLAGGGTAPDTVSTRGTPSAVAPGTVGDARAHPSTTS